ncbi:MAG: dimethyladenosine transferase, rRNA (adenine1518-N6/adenine1519-N6)-dimethyltransferase [Candidatus Parcubacteria bacterium]|jgi:16S rRNA (adenine1518-N6/adenine1519-N6)-dimethyltransferase
MKQIHHTAKKSLGQNFLTSIDTVKKIVATGEVVSTDTVFEIGPGKGVLTRELLATGATVIAVEKDDALFTYLQEEFRDALSTKKLQLIHADILDIVENFAFPANYKLIANIPYNITGKLLSIFLSHARKPSCAVLMVQYEVAARITSRDTKGSILAISVAVYGKPVLVKRVPAGSFYPKPRVDSAILLIADITDTFFRERNISQELFFKVLKVGFAHKRKKLLRNLFDVFPDTDWHTIFVKLNLDENTRPEDITKEVWGELTKLV